MPESTGLFNRLTVRVRALRQGNWFAAAGQRFRVVTGRIAEFSKENRSDSDPLPHEVSDPNQRGPNGEVDATLVGAAERFAKLENLRVKLRQEEELTTDEEEKAQILGIRRQSEGLELVMKLRAAGVIILEPGDDKEIRVEPARDDFPWEELQRRLQTGSDGEVST